MNILVTGGASGLGAAIVKALAKDNRNTVYFTFSKSLTAAKEIEAAYPNTKALSCDFTIQSSVDEFVNQLADFDIDILVNNACGPIHKEHFYKTDPNVFLNSFEHNVVPVLKIAQQALKTFRKKKSGKIINILSSAIVNKPPIGWAEYVANKSYLLAMSTIWATEGSKFNIASNSLSPTFMQTSLTSDTDERIIEQMIADHPMKRLLTTEEVANAVLFLVNADQQVTGKNFVIDAGTDIALLA